MDDRLTKSQRNAVAMAIEGYLSGSKSFNTNIFSEVEITLQETIKHYRSPNSLFDLDKFIGAFSQHLPYTHIDDNEVIFGAQLVGWYKLHNLAYFVGQEKLKYLPEVIKEREEILIRHILEELDGGKI